MDLDAQERERRGSGLLPCCPLFPCSVVGCSRARPPAALARAPSLYRPSLALSAVCLSFCHSLAPSSGLQFDTPFRAEERIEGGRRSTTTRSLHSPPLPPLALLRFSPVRHVRHVGALRSRPFSVFQRPSRSSSLSLSILTESLLPSFVGCHWEAPRGHAASARRPRSVLGRRRLLHHQTRQQLTTTESERAESPSCAGAFPKRNTKENERREGLFSFSWV